MDKTATKLLISVLSGGKFLCQKIDMAENTDVLREIENIYGNEFIGEIILANILLDKFQIETKK